MWEYVYPDELYHHGTKGMKWGKRLYQNKDGSLTPLGRVRYRTNKDFKGQVDKERALAKARAARAAKKSVEEKRAELLKSVDPKEIYANKHLLTTQELNDRINRIDTEARLQSKIVTEQQKTGMDYVNDKMKSGKNTLDNAVNLFKSVDSAYSTVTSSAIGKVLAKKLGLEPKKKDFDWDDFVKNIASKSTQELQEASKRAAAEDIVRTKQKKWKDEADAEAKQKEWQKQIDDYNEKWREGKDSDSVRPTDYSKSGSDITDSKTGTGNKNPNVLLLEQIDRYEASGKDVVGEGTSRFTGWDDGPVVNAVYDGEKYVSTLLQLEDKSSSSNLPANRR